MLKVTGLVIALIYTAAAFYSYFVPVYRPTTLDGLACFVHRDGTEFRCMTKGKLVSVNLVTGERTTVKPEGK